MNLREIDRLVAEKVMRWRLKSFAGGGGGFVAWVDDDGKIVKYENDCTLHAHPIAFWKPTTNITDAWQVVEKIIEQFGSYSLTKIKDGGHYCEVLYWNRGAFDIIAEVEAETAPLAICLAALKAVGVEMEGEPK